MKKLELQMLTFYRWAKASFQVLEILMFWESEENLLLKEQQVWALVTLTCQ